MNNVVAAIIKKNNQYLAFEPVNFEKIFEKDSKEGTIAGALSCNFSGSRRFKVGSARDHILGFKGYNGKGEKIKSGGTVQKNVTGYDLSKLIVGSFGTLVVLTEITLKVLPALAAGCTMILKPSEIAPLSGMVFAEILDEAKVPKGVFNLVNGILYYFYPGKTCWM